MSRNRLPAPSSSSSQRPSGGLPSNPRPSSPSSSRPEPPYPASTPPATYVDPSGPRRPTRSVRRPNGQPPPSSDSQSQDPSSLAARLNRDPRSRHSPSPEPERKQSVWDEDRLERERAMEARLRKEARTDSEVFKAAQVGQAFALAVKDRKAKESSEASSGKGKGQQLEEDELDDLNDPTGEFERINAVLRDVKKDWAFVTDPNFNPIPLALSLLNPPPSSRLNLSSFQSLSTALLRSLQSTVQTHSSAFASSISTHNSFLSTLSQAQTEVREARRALSEAKEALSGERKAEVGALWARGRIVKEMISVLDVMEHLKSVPDQLETLMAEKKLLLASLVLVRALKTVNKPEMMEIGALSDLRSYFASQEIVLQEILIEELHNHLYLKSYYCDSRWTAYVRGQQKLPDLEVTDRDLFPSPLSQSPSQTDNNPSPASPSSRKSTKLTLYLQDLLMRPSLDPLLDIPEDLSTLPPLPLPTHNRGGSASQQPSAVEPGNGNTSISSFSSSGPNPLGALANPTSASKMANPEADSFIYIEHLLEALAALGKLGWGLDLIAQRETSELFALIEQTVNEVEERSADRRRESMMLLLPATTLLPPPPSASSLDAPPRSTSVNAGSSGSTAFSMHSLNSNNMDENAETLRDLFWTMYSKLDAVLQGLRVVWEVSGRIGGRKDFKDDSGTTTRRGTMIAGDILEIWKPIQVEIRSLLREYLTSEDPSSVSARHPISSINEILRNGKLSKDRSKSIFRLVDSDNKVTSRILKKHDDELSRALRSAVPGLVNLSTTANSNPTADHLISTSSSHTLEDRSSSGSAAAGGASSAHRVLVKPDAFNVSVLFQPTLAFLERAGSVMPVGIEDESSGLDEFVVKVYLPQLEEKVSDLFQLAVTSSEAFEEDSGWRLVSNKPVTKCTTQVISLINNLCSMLRTTPFHRENYSRLIISVIIQFYQRCSGFFRDIAAQVSLSSSAGEELSISALWAQRQELIMCMSAIFETAPDDFNRLRQLGRQETRLEMGLKADEFIPESQMLSSTRKFAQLGNLYQSLTWFMARLNALKGTPTGSSSVNGLASPSPQDTLNPRLEEPVDADAQLPLTRAMSARFDALLETYKQLAEMALFTMRIEVRCRSMHFIDLAMRKGNYRIEQEAFEPDPNIIDLINDLGKFEEVADACLPEAERIFIFRGLGSLADDLIVSSARYIRFCNAEGVRKIERNLLALQQSLKTLVDDPLGVDFERARSYWSLFFVGPNEMIESLRVARPAFAYDDYKSLLSLQLGIDQAPPKEVDGSTAALQGDRKAFNSHLIDLMSIMQADD